MEERMWPQGEWVIYKCEGVSIPVRNNREEKMAKQVLTEDYQLFTVVQCLDYTSGEILDTLTLNDLYGEKTL
jgi:hypothetical protein